MNLNDLITGLVIFREYYDKPESTYIGAEHDILYVYPTDTPLPEEEVRVLKEMGWFQEDVMEGQPYDPNEGWMCYT